MIVDKPDVVVLDGNGISHPRRMGVSSHFGILTNQSTIGCVESLLHGKNHQPQNVKYSINSSCSSLNHNPNFLFHWLQFLESPFYR